MTKSKYFNKSKSNYADLSDYNIEQMKSDYIKKYDMVDEKRNDRNDKLCDLFIPHEVRHSLHDR